MKIHQSVILACLLILASCNPLGSNPLASRGFGGSGGTGTVTVPANFHPGLVAPTIISISPNQGPLVGGTNVTINGTGFKPGAIAKMGETNCVSTTFVSSIKLICMTPAHPISNVNVTVTNTDQLKFTLVGVYAYTSNVSGVPGFGVVSAGVVHMQGSSISLQGSAGEPGAAGGVQTGSTVQLRGGVQGVLWEP